MNLGIRAFLYTARKWKKTLLLFCLLLSITTLVLSGLAIADAQEKQTEECVEQPEPVLLWREICLQADGQMAATAPIVRRSLFPKR